MAVTGDFKKAFLQVRVGPEERDALIFHCLKNLDTREVDTLRFTRALFGLSPSPFLLAGVIEHHLDGRREKRSEIVSEMRKKLSVDDLTGGGNSKVEAKEYKTTVMEIFVDAAFELHKWHSDLPELDSEVTEKNNEDQTFAKQQPGSTEGGGRTIIGLWWDKQRDIVSIAVLSEKMESTKRVY